MSSRNRRKRRGAEPVQREAVRREAAPARGTVFVGGQVIGTMSKMTFEPRYDEADLRDPVRFPEVLTGDRFTASQRALYEALERGRSHVIVMSPETHPNVVRMSSREEMQTAFGEASGWGDPGRLWDHLERIARPIAVFGAGGTHEAATVSREVVASAARHETLREMARRDWELSSEILGNDARSLSHEIAVALLGPELTAMAENMRRIADDTQVSTARGEALDRVVAEIAPVESLAARTVRAEMQLELRDYEEDQLVPFTWQPTVTPIERPPGSTDQVSEIVWNQERTEYEQMATPTPGDWRNAIERVLAPHGITKLDSSNVQVIDLGIGGSGSMESPWQPWGWHPSHRIWHDDAGVWRCACGAHGSGLLRAIYRVCMLHCVANLPGNPVPPETERDVFLEQGRFMTMEIVAKMAYRIDAPICAPEEAPVRTEEERCLWLAEWAIRGDATAAKCGVYVPPHTDYGDEWNLGHAIDLLNARDVRRGIEMEQENSHALFDHNPHRPRSRTRDWPDHGGLVRLGCPEREADGVTPRKP